MQHTITSNFFADMPCRSSGTSKWLHNGHVNYNLRRFLQSPRATPILSIGMASLLSIRNGIVH